MNKKIILAACGVFVFITAGAILSLQGTVFAQNREDACNALGGCDNPPGQTTVESVAKTTVKILSYFVGVVAVVMIIIGGFLYLTSGGDSNRVASAKNTIIYAIVGLVIALLAQALVRFVFAKTTTPPVTSDKKESSLIDPGTIDSISV